MIRRGAWAWQERFEDEVSQNLERGRYIRVFLCKEESNRGQSEREFPCKRD